MNKFFLMGKLKSKLTLWLLIAFTLSVGLFLVLQTTGEELLDNYSNKSSFIENQEKKAFSDFKQYVTDHKLTLADHEQLAKWVRKTKYVNLHIYQNNKLVLTTDGYTTTTGESQSLLSTVTNHKSLQDVTALGANTKIYMEYFFEYKYYTIVAIVGVAISFLFFILLILYFINKKTSYISLLENEIKILEGGDLNYPITIKGNGKDELSSLAQSINEMRKSFIERLENEDQARTANSELITAMSHDLRTPLTALIGYLDIIELKKYRSDEALNKYIHNSREKAYQIKHLSDKLFEYFSLFNIDDEALKLDLFDGNQLIEQLIDEQLLTLEHHGFQFNLVSSRNPFQIKVHLISLRRVFDNIFSNITKYADHSKPILIHYAVKDQILMIQIQNDINTELHNESSTGIGMKTCKKIIEQHNGSIDVINNETYYSVHIRLHVAG